MTMDFNETLSPYHHPYDALREQAKVRAGAPALCFPLSGGNRTFAEWFEQSSAFAAGLIRLGVAPGEHVALLAENRVEWPVVQLAVAAVGAVLVPLNTHYRRDDLAFALKQSRARVLILSPRFRNNDYLATIRDIGDELANLDELIVLDDAQSGTRSYASILEDDFRHPVEFERTTPDDVGSLQYTSGTTGFPKGALLTHHGMLANAWRTATRLDVRPGDRWTSIIPLFHCAGCIMNLFGCLQSGATYVGVPAFDPVTLFRVIENECCTHLSGVPTSYLAMLEHPERERFDLGSLRGGTCGGADCDPAVLERCAREFPMDGLCQVYGQTEASTLVSCPAHDDPQRWSSAGRPLPGYSVRITDPQTGAALSPGEHGQIEAKGDMLLTRYHNDCEASACAMTPDHWLKTGDLGYLTDDGHLVIAGGRLKDMIIRGGENIYPVEIENLLLAHPGVRKAAVLGLADDYYGERVVAVVELQSPLPAHSLSESLQHRIAGFKIPVEYYACEEFPMTASGKIRKVELKAQLSSRKLAKLP